MSNGRMKAHCPRCDAERQCDLHAMFKEPWQWESEDGLHSNNGERDHYLVQCRGCETVFYLMSSWESEQWDERYDPATGKEEIFCPLTWLSFPQPESVDRRPDWAWNLHSVDGVLSAVLDEIYQAGEQNLLALATMGMRTAFDRASELLGVDPSLTFEEKVSRLAAQGLVGAREAESLRVLVEAGCAAAHRAWMPEKSQFETLMRALEQFIHRSLVLRTLEHVAPDIPLRPKRKGKDSDAEQGSN